MKWCKHCGKELLDEAVFCGFCGTKCKIRNRIMNNPNGNMHNFVTNNNANTCKCKICGEPLNPMDVRCSACGYEIRSDGNALREFKMKLEVIDREKINAVANGKNSENIRIALDEQKISLINNFVIPMNKEDVYEVLMLAKNNMSVRYPSYATEQEKNSIARVIRTWKIKYDDASKMANTMFSPEEYRRVFNREQYQNSTDNPPQNLKEFFKQKFW